MGMRTPLEEAINSSTYLRSFIASHVGIQEKALSEFISGESQPDLGTAIQISRLLGTPVEELWGA